MEKVATVSNLPLKALDVVSASKQKFYIRSQKELSLLKIQIIAFLDKRLRKLTAIFSNINFLFFTFREIMLFSFPPLGGSFPTIPNLLKLVKYLKS